MILGSLAGLLFIFALCGCASSGSIDQRNFAIDTYSPRPNAVALALARARAYSQQHASSLAQDSTYLAVQASFIFPSEMGPNLFSKLIDSETTGSFFAREGEDANYSDLNLYGVLIFDPKTQNLVTPQGYVVVDTPQRGRIARFGPYLARYIGTGWSW